jgi:hypothetical protein
MGFFGDDMCVDNFVKFQRIRVLEEENRKLRQALHVAGEQHLQNHGLRWTEEDKRKIFWRFQEFVRANAGDLNRSKQSIRIRVLRTLKDEYPEDWDIAHRR